MKPIPTSIRDFTPDPIKKSILELHAKYNNAPNKKFLWQHANAITNLPSSSFRRYCTLSFHIDGGVNVNSIKDENLFYFFIKGTHSAQMVDGSLVQAKGWGGVLISLGTNTYMISPVFHCLKNPKNTFTPTTVLSFSKFSRAIVDTHHKVVLVDNNNTRHDIITTKDTDLDFVDLNIFWGANNFLGSKYLDWRKWPLQG